MSAYMHSTPAAFVRLCCCMQVGMAKDLVAEVPAAKALFDKASEILGYDLLQVYVKRSLHLL